MRAHRGSSVTDGSVGFTVAARVALIILQASMGSEELCRQFRSYALRSLLSNTNCAPPRSGWYQKRHYSGLNVWLPDASPCRTRFARWAKAYSFGVTPVAVLNMRWK